jgi:putative DeoR family transcriptional regulator (stage III sporulation protein D)
MNSKINKRVTQEAMHMIDTKDTIREIARVFNVSKSTVHKDLNDRLYNIDINIYNEVSKILKNHLETRHIKGGESTRIKYLNIS